MMSIRTKYAIAIGVLIAFGAGGFTAAAYFGKSSPGTAPAVALSTSATTALAASTTIQQNTITVVGSGAASGVPNEATVGIGVQATRPNVHEAVNVAAADMQRLLGALHHQGVADRDIQTSSISIYSQTNCCPQQTTSYVSANLLSVTIHHLANVSSVVEAAVQAVGNDIQLNGVSLSIADPAPMVKAARAAAMSDAGVRAQTWAGLAHHHVGGLITLSEIVLGPTAITCNGCGRGSGGGGMPIQPGQTDVSVTITAVYELLP